MFLCFQEHQVLILMDFSENYSTTSQHEIQQAHFKKTSISLFTAVAYSKDFIQSYLVVSDEKDHTKQSVWLYQKNILEDLKQKRPMTSEVHIFSDGCAQQFKNVYTLSTLAHSQKDFNLQIEHHFFGTSHGKGPHDGIGGTFKRKVREKVLSQNLNCTTAEEFYNIAKSLSQNTVIILFPKHDISEQTKHLDTRWENMKTMPGTRSCHHFKAIGEANLEACVTSYGEDSRKYKFQKIPRKNKK